MSTLRLKGVQDISEQVMQGEARSTFTTFKPVELQRITGVDARDVVWVHAPGTSECADAIAVAEGDGLRPDIMGGIRIYDVTDLSQAPTLLAEQDTAGVDWALHYVPAEQVDPPITTAGPYAHTWNGPFLLSTEGRGQPQRFGVFHVFDLSTFRPRDDAPVPGLMQAAVRLINQSADTLALIQNAGSQASPPPEWLYRIPADIGNPFDVASIGSQVAYVANTPYLGVQAINLGALDTTYPPSVNQEDGALRGYVRTLTTFGDKVVAVRQVAGNEELVVWNGQLSAELGKYQLRGGTHALGVTVLKSWTVHPQLGDSTTVTRDIAVTECAEGLCIVPIDTNGSFLNYEALYVKTPGGRPVSVQGDKDTNLLFVADGTSGLTIIDLASLGASRDDDGDGVDDRVLGTTDLDGGARAQKVAVWRDIFGKLMVAVAAGRDGIFIVDPPAPPSPTPSWQLSITQPAGQLPSVPIGPQPQTPQITVQAEITGVTLQPGQTVAFKWNAVMKSRFESCNNATSTVLARETRSDFIRKKGEKSDPKVPALVDTYNVPFTNGIEGNELTVSVTAAVCGSGQSTASKVIKIPGTNPSRSAIQGALGIDMLRQIACLESGQCQFDATPSGGIEMCPRFSGDGQGGVGVMQITVPVNGSEPSYADHWDWTANVNSGLAKWNYALPFAQGYPASIKPTSRWVSLVNNLNLYREASGGTCASPLSDVQLQFTAQQVAEDAARVYNGLTDSDGFTHNLHEYRLQIQTVNVPNQGNVELPNVTPVGQVAPTPVDCSYTGAVQVVWERSPCVLRKHAPDAAAASYVENALLQAPTCPSPACQPQVPAQQCAGWAP